MSIKPHWTFSKDRTLAFRNYYNEKEEFWYDVTVSLGQKAVNVFTRPNKAFDDGLLVLEMMDGSFLVIMDKGFDKKGDGMIERWVCCSPEALAKFLAEKDAVQIPFNFVPIRDYGKNPFK